jgi:hypothetical protein
MSPWMFQVGLNVTVDETWVDVRSRHRRDWGLLVWSPFSPQGPQGGIGSNLRIEGRGGHWKDTEELTPNRPQVQYQMCLVSDCFVVRLVWYQIGSESDWF